MRLSTARCPRCQREVLVALDVAPGADPLTAPVVRSCVDCGQPLDGPLPPVIDERSGAEVAGLGYGVPPLD